MKKGLKIIGVIPAHLDSKRFKRKILHNIMNLPMIEHVRRRVLRTKLLENVYVASGDNEILNKVSDYGGNIIKTYRNHPNGTSRVAESIETINCTHVIVIQGDEPLIQYEHIKNLVKAIENKPEIDSWNSTSSIISKEDLNKENIVKAAVNENNRILYCFRKTPSYSNYENQIKYIKKIQGLIAFKKEIIKKINSYPPSECEIYESIEQLRIISNGISLFSVNQSNQVPSINQKIDLEDLEDYLNENADELKITNEICRNIY